MQARPVNLNVGVEALRRFVETGKAPDSAWGRALRALGLEPAELDGLRTGLARLSLPGYLSLVALQRLKLDHERAFTLSMAAVAQAFFFVFARSDEIDGDPKRDGRLHTAVEACHFLRRRIDPRAEPTPTRLFERVAGLDQQLQEIGPPEDVGPVSKGASTATLAKSLLSLRAWARDEPVDPPELLAAIEVVDPPEELRLAYRTGFSGLLTLLPSLSRETVEAAALPPVARKALAVGVVMHGALALARFRQERSAGAFAAIQRRGGVEALRTGDEARAELLEVDSIAEAVALRLAVEDDPNGWAVVRLRALRSDIATAVEPSLIDHMAEATASGNHAAITPDKLGFAPDGTPLPLDSPGRPTLRLTPSLGLAMHGLGTWQRDEHFLPEVDAAIASLEFSDALKQAFEPGRVALEALPPEFGPVDLVDADLPEAALVSAAMGTLVYERLVEATEASRVPGLAGKKHEVGQFAAYLALCLEPSKSEEVVELASLLDATRIRCLSRRLALSADAGGLRATPGLLLMVGLALLAIVAVLAALFLVGRGG